MTTTTPSKLSLVPLESATPWRFIPPFQAPGRLQMALDAWLFHQHCLGLHPPTLRFYTWAPAAISLGFHQRQWPTEWQEITWQERPLELVQRPTGGRAVLHQGDLTYAVITSGFPGNRTQAYQAICEFLIQGWRSLGVELQYGEAGRGYIHNPNCFGTATSADLILPNGEKLIGSAQLRRGSAILQHGSMRLEPDATLFAQVFGPDNLHLPKLPLSLQGTALTQTLIEALVTALQRCFGVQLVPQPLSESEWQAVMTQAELIKSPAGSGPVAVS
ncbi:lipoate--protein ligase family protein [Trichocoleus sp. FACHB-591]|uniref:lipoate--protein ligase family protein n=1 Tax=Trichocoleus sp. FACHB-591 TaxID=2692872 RepID=UPI001681D216|nr:biotin/lipoate A/B protein ligase family protein [Trichocoleus sp. FACHB-591]MBD2098806.1 lipoate--protein ligase family protein [Trichocoleus sp. FACHB-591]